MKKHITLIRHTESQFNHNKKYNLDLDTDDLLDCGLTSLGKIQAEKLKLKFDLLIISPLKRCIKTYTNSGIRTNKFMILELFREYKTDICDFMEDDDVSEKESESDIIERVEKAKKFLTTLEDKNIGIITHGDFIWYFTSYIKNGERFGKYLNNGEIYKIKFKMNNI